jgi:hypothetical protein
MIMEVYAANAYASFVVSWTFNGALIWLIRHKTPANMKDYGRILVQTCMLDMLLSLSSVLQMPVNSLPLFFVCVSNLSYHFY